MEILFEKLGKIVLTGAIAISSIFGGYSTAEAPKLGATIPTAVAVFQTSLNASIGANDTSMTLVSAVDAAGNTLASSTYGFVIDEGTASEEFVLANCTGVTCTGMIRGISPTTGNTTVTALKKAHRRGASVKITDSPLLLITTRILNGQENLPNTLSYDSNKSIASTSNSLAHATWVNSNYVNKDFSETITGTKTFINEITIPTPTASTSAANKGYIDGVAIAGSPNAGTSTKGIVQEATTTEIIAGLATGTTGARLYINPSAISTSGASKVVLTKTDGTLDTSLVPPLEFFTVKNIIADNRSFWSNIPAKITGTNAKIVYSSPTQAPTLRVPQSDWASANETQSFIVTSIYTYALLKDASNNYRVYRYNSSDISTGGTLMTISGQAFSTSGSSEMKMSYDGTSFYFTHKAGNSSNSWVISKYSLSGTTLTYVSDTSIGSTALVDIVLDTSGNYYALRTAVSRKIAKYDSSGTLLYETPELNGSTNKLSYYMGYIYTNWDSHDFFRINLP